MYSSWQHSPHLQLVYFKANLDTLPNHSPLINGMVHRTRTIFINNIFAELNSFRPGWLQQQNARDQLFVIFLFDS